MKYLLSILLCISTSSFAQTYERYTGDYLEKIRSDEAKLTAFFQAMPKGGDLHIHFSGAIYPEEFFDVARANGFYVDTITFDIFPSKPDARPNAIEIKGYRGRIDIRGKLISLWSVKDFVAGPEASDDHFFATFGKFGPAVSGYESEYLKALKTRSIKENIQYLETMFVRPNFDHSNTALMNELTSYDTTFARLQSQRNTIELDRALTLLTDKLIDSYGFKSTAMMHLDGMKDIYKRASFGTADTLIEVRFLNYVTRVVRPSDVFGQLLLSFLSVDNDLILGVNIVAPEDNEVSMRDYWLHCQMFRFLKKRFPNVKTTMHAGELTLGLVKPEDLTWHINEAVLAAGANRIGHGVDMAYEKDCYALLDSMKKRNVAIEINLVSNEFILGVKNERHPFSLYFSHNVPIVLSTDDAGVLRTNHTEQFVLATSRYKEVHYSDIKRFVYNSIDHSFLPREKKQVLRKRLDDRFYRFEKKIVSEAK
ncbi:MAG TPA: adenosine deaminase [Candidatus Kapabacteria bacterium]